MGEGFRAIRWRLVRAHAIMKCDLDTRRVKRSATKITAARLRGRAPVALIHVTTHRVFAMNGEKALTINIVRELELERS